MANNFMSLTARQKWLTKRFLVYKFLTSMWFISAVWLYFYRLHVTDSQVGILDGIAFTIGLIAEVPSGAMADKFGRAKMVKIGQLLVGSGFLIQAVGSSFLYFLVGQSVLMIGAAFVSGADEALFFDELKFNKSSKEWRTLIARGSQVGLVASTTATIIGGLLHTINPIIPWLLTSLAFLFSVIFIWPIHESKKVATQKEALTEFKEYLSSIKSGFLAFGTKKLFLYVPLIITLQGLFYTSSMGLLRLVLLDRFTFTPFNGAIAVSVSSLLTIAFLALMNKYADKLSEKRVLTGISVIAGSALLFSIANIGIWGFLVILALYAGNYMLEPFMSEIINYRTAPGQRATALSVSSFLRTLPYIALAPIIGYLNTNDKLEYFLFSWAVLIGLALSFYLLIRKRDAQISLTDE